MRRGIFFVSDTIEAGFRKEEIGFLIYCPIPVNARQFIPFE